MRITSATITVTDVTSAAAYYVQTLGLPVTERDDGVDVRLGSSTLSLRPGPAFEGEHHVALGIAPEDFETVLGFAREHLAPIAVGGTDVIEGPAGWDSRSIYFRGPEGIVLEYIAREAHRGLSPAQPAGSPRVTSLSEVGVAVADVPAAVARLGRSMGVPPFSAQSDDFAPVGDHDGLLILVDPTRTWFPTHDASPARGPATVTLAGDGGRPVDLVLGATTTVRLRG